MKNGVWRRMTLRGRVLGKCDATDATSEIRHRPRSDGLQPDPEIGVDEGRALQASYLRTMSDRRDVLEAAWHSNPHDDRIAAALVKGFLNA
jgi:hypothetical protein